MTHAPNAITETTDQLAIGHDEYDPEPESAADDQGPELTTTVEMISDALAQAEAEVDRLRDKKAAIREAEGAASRQVRLGIVRQAANSWAIDCNRARSRAQEHLENLAIATRFDVAKLAAAFGEFKLADARCGANALYARNLDRTDPLPDSPIGAPRERSLRTGQQYADLTWSRYLDQVINDRARAERDRCFNLLQSFAHEQTENAAATARAAALALDDYESLDVPQPPAIAELHQSAVAAINEHDFDPEQMKAAGVISVRRAAQNAELEKLIDAGN
ncbi:hypothetical protein [Mycolicibacterium sphagni]|uniref:Uncharacterized protein n=1 Tax=Mycolicibacterium sphagni TaxID=1786 RepID=A0A255DU90_9MYCO|nr:hypothetical protein [Mycolicibacterium sphagni]OYN82958.1 hypothetical protein CG716_01815 [Mycolicibacterium sphagni]